MAHTIRDIGVARHIGRYSDAIEAAPGLRWLHTAGTPGMSEGGEVPADVEEQARLAWANIGAALAAAGMGLADVVKVTTTLVDAADMPASVKVRSEVLGDLRPASMLVVVSQLVRPEIRIEIEVIAAAP